QALALRERLVEDDAASLMYQSDLTATLMGLAEVSRRAGRLEQARPWWSKALPIVSRAVDRRPDDPRAWRDLGTASAGLGQPDAAVAAVSKAIAPTPEPKEWRHWG